MDDAYSVREDTPLVISAMAGVLSNDTDADSDPLTAILVTGPSNGTLTLNADGSFDYTPDLDFNGSDTFIYRANDRTSDGNEATVTIDVILVNVAPMVEDDGYTVDEEEVIWSVRFAPITQDQDGWRPGLILGTGSVQARGSDQSA